jgi:hypothetical protein
MIFIQIQLDNWEADFEPGSIDNSKLATLSLKSDDIKKPVTKNPSYSKPPMNTMEADDGNWEHDVEIDEKKITKATSGLLKRVSSSKSQKRSDQPTNIVPTHHYQEGPEDFSDVHLPDDPAIWAKKLAGNSRRSSQVSFIECVFWFEEPCSL